MAKNYERSEIRQEQIIKAALALIAATGVRSFTTRALAEKVGLTDGSLFRHFKNKKSIVFAAIDQLEAWLNPPKVVADATPLGDLEHFFKNRAKTVTGLGPHRQARLYRPAGQRRWRGGPRQSPQLAKEKYRPPQNPHIGSPKGRRA